MYLIVFDVSKLEWVKFFSSQAMLQIPHGNQKENFIDFRNDLVYERFFAAKSFRNFGFLSKATFPN